MRIDTFPHVTYYYVKIYGTTPSVVKIEEVPVPHSLNHMLRIFAKTCVLHGHVNTIEWQFAMWRTCFTSVSMIVREHLP